MKWESEAGKQAAAYAAERGFPGDCAVIAIAGFLDSHCLALEEALEAALPEFCAKHPGVQDETCERCRKGAA